MQGGSTLVFSFLNPSLWGTRIFQHTMMVKGMEFTCSYAAHIEVTGEVPGSLLVTQSREGCFVKKLWVTRCTSSAGRRRLKGLWPGAILTQVTGTKKGSPCLLQMNSFNFHSTHWKLNPVCWDWFSFVVEQVRKGLTWSFEINLSGMECLVRLL